MVTPVHRFQSIESLANRGLSCGRSSGFYTRHPVQCQRCVYYNGTTSSIRNNSQMDRTVEMINAGQIQSPCRSSVLTAITTCSILVVLFVILGAVKSYFNSYGVNVSMEVFALGSLLVMIPLIGGLVLLDKAITATVNTPPRETATANTPPREIATAYAPPREIATASAPPREAITAPFSIDQQMEYTQNNQVPNSVIPLDSAESEPPPYHIAIMLPTPVIK